MTRTSESFTARMTRAAATAAPTKTTPVRHAVAPLSKLDQLSGFKAQVARNLAGIADLNRRIADLKRGIAILEKRFAK